MYSSERGALAVVILHECRICERFDQPVCKLQDLHGFVHCLVQIGWDRKIALSEVCVFKSHVHSHMSLCLLSLSSFSPVYLVFLVSLSFSCLFCLSRLSLICLLCSIPCSYWKYLILSDSSFIRYAPKHMELVYHIYSISSKRIWN